MTILDVTADSFTAPLAFAPLLEFTGNLAATSIII